MDSSLFLNVFMKDSNNASQRLLTIEHSACYVTFVRLQGFYCIFGLFHFRLREHFFKKHNNTVLELDYQILFHLKNYF
ncbi:hypothetical protein T10_11157 [Trichinella papuae]|uniref:Uncharacterized protein n=1 Tax=Trichinella papuae TaxID=268474 RepID=A0A0V1MLR2_9BILA|nr:hypothetical protein T10_11157 [Trichinella papuae]